MRRGATGTMAVLVVLSVATLAGGCTDTLDGPLPSSASPSAARLSASATASIPKSYTAARGAKGNQPLFDAVLAPLTSDSGFPTTKVLRHALEAVGFPAQDTTTTQDTTPQGRDVDSKVVAVKIGNECLIGQFVQGYRSEVVDPVYGKCLIGLHGSSAER